MNVALRERGQAVVLDVEGQITFEAVAKLREQFQQAMLRSELAIVVNLARVDYLDSSGLAVLVEGLKMAQGAGRAFGMYGVTKNVRNVIELVRLDSILNIFRDEDQAMRGLACALPAEGGAGA